ncbi:MAG: enoyl-CoA hydratase/carnithine racemase [Actinomycetia bacterium]|nr:enoyl-CoA hydratase/carnithine racemase [Actinomycetes bacterium]
MIHWEPRGGVALATIDRPERRNALNAELCAALLAHVEAAPAEGVRAIVITGTPPAFCAGADLVTRFGGHDAAGDADAVADAGYESDHAETSHGGDTFRPTFERMLDAFEAFPGAVIAAVNGAAYGAGMQLAVACDLRVMAAGARAAIPAAKLGIVLSGPNISRLERLVGPGAASSLLMGAAVFDAEECARVGFAQRVVGDALATSLEWAAEIVGLAPLSVSSHKQALHGAPPAVVADLERVAFASRDLQEGMSAFAEKRPARFEGR